MAGKEMKRLTVTLDIDDYRKLDRLARGRRPKLSYQYVLNYAVQQLLKRADDPQLFLELGNPVEREGQP